jgi:large subunit ribosomal protein L6
VSRIGLKVVNIPAGVTVTNDGDNVTVKGPKGELTRQFDSNIKMSIEGTEAKFTRESDAYKALHGTTRANFNNMVIGVTEGFKKDLSLVGVGYRAQMQGSKLVLNVGYSHPVEMEAPAGVKVEVPATTSITVSGISKQEVGEFAAQIRAVRSPEPYKGKGIRYVDEVVRRKEGKTGK